MDLASQTAWVGLNDTAVDGSLIRFSLVRPIVRQDNEVLVSAGDVVPFFRKAFRVDLTATASDLKTAPERGKDADASIPLEQPAEKTPPAPENRPGAAENRPIGVVIVDAGHGGANVGAEGEHGVKEKDVTLAVARQLKKVLEQSKSVKVFLTRDGDGDVSWRDRLGFASKNKGDLYISIHAGASPSGAASGIALFVPPRGDVVESRAPAQGAAAPRQEYSTISLQIATAAVSSLNAAGAAPAPGLRALRTRVSRNLPMPSVLVEIGYLTNAEECGQLQTEAYQAKIAGALAEAILKFTAPPVAAGGGQ